MLPQLTVYAKILYLLMMMIAGALCNTDHVYLYSKCSSRFLGITPDGKVQANDNSGSGQHTIKISNPPDFVEGPLKLALFIEEAQTYVCFTKRWRIVTSKKLHDYCYFYETMANGWFQYHSAVDPTRPLGFTKRGKPLPNRPRPAGFETQCINFHKESLPKRHPHHHQYQQTTTAVQRPTTTSTSATHPTATTSTSTVRTAPVAKNRHQAQHQRDARIHHQQVKQQHQLLIAAEERQQFEQHHHKPDVMAPSVIAAPQTHTMTPATAPAKTSAVAKAGRKQRLNHHKQLRKQAAKQAQAPVQPQATPAPVPVRPLPVMLADEPVANSRRLSDMQQNQLDYVADDVTDDDDRMMGAAAASSTVYHRVVYRARGSGAIDKQLVASVPKTLRSQLLPPLNGSMKPGIGSSRSSGSSNNSSHNHSSGSNHNNINIKNNNSASIRGSSNHNRSAASSNTNGLMASSSVKLRHTKAHAKKVVHDGN